MGSFLRFALTSLVLRVMLTLITVPTRPVRSDHRMMSRQRSSSSGLLAGGSFPVTFFHVAESALFATVMPAREAAVPTRLMGFMFFSIVDEYP